VNDLYNFINFKYFCDAVRLGSLSAAARANFVTQSAVSQGIAKLEKSLGFSLLVHQPNRFKLTPEGEATFNYALTILNRIGEFKNSFSNKGEPIVGNLEFVTTFSFATAVLPRYLKRFRKEHPRSKINFGLGKNDEIKKMVSIGKIDFGILPDEGDLDEFEKKEIYSGSFKLYVSKKIAPSNYSKLGFIFAPAKRRETLLIKKGLAEAYATHFKKKAEVIMEVGSWDVIVHLVAEGMGIGYFPDFFGVHHKGSLKELPLEIKSHPYTMCAISHRDIPLRHSSKLFLSYF